MKSKHPRDGKHQGDGDWGVGGEESRRQGLLSVTCPSLKPRLESR